MFRTVPDYIQKGLSNMKAKLNAERLAEQRKRLGITKLEASKRMHLTQSGYVRYESGERNPTYSIIMVMAEVLGTSAAYLTGVTDDPAADSILITKDGDPAIFEIAKKLVMLDEKQLKKVQTLFGKL